MDWNSRWAAGAVPRPRPEAPPSPSTETATCVPWPVSTSREPSFTIDSKQKSVAPGQLLIALIRLAGMCAWAVAAVPPPMPVSAMATVWVEPS